MGEEVERGKPPACISRAAERPWVYDSIDVSRTSIPVSHRLGAARLALVLAPAILACSSPAADGEVDTEVLVFSRTVAYRHASIEPGIEALREMAGEAGIGLTATEDPDVFSDGGLAPYDAVVFLSTSGDVLDEDQQSALEAFVHRGGGFAGIHAAADTEYDWPWYGELVGAYFEWHPPGIYTATLHVAEADHPATAALPDPWVRDDEWYDLRDVQEGLSILLEIDETTYKTADDDPLPTPRPIAWYREFDGGRTFYTALGHTSASFDEPAFRAHVWGGLQWVLGS